MTSELSGPQQVYRAETMACMIVSVMASQEDDIVMDNQGVLKATPAHAYVGEAIGGQSCRRDWVFGPSLL